MRRNGETKSWVSELILGRKLMFSQRHGRSTHCHSYETRREERKKRRRKGWEGERRTTSLARTSKMSTAGLFELPRNGASASCCHFCSDFHSMGGIRSNENTEGSGARIFLFLKTSFSRARRLGACFPFRSKKKRATY